MRHSLAVCFALLSGPLYAADASTGFSNKQPIEINADQLEVRQQESIAVFTGNVIAVQETTRLKSDTMTVHYKKKEGAEQASSPTADATQGSVERIVVDGNVFLTTPQETASGDHGVYEVTNKQVTLTSNVVLTRGKNVLKGDSLVYSFITGKSVIDTQKNGSGNGRVRALFVPEDKGGKP